MLFQTIDEARRFIAGVTSADVTDALVALLIPVLVLDPAPSGSANTGPLSQLGGTPVMSAEIDWPIPAIPDDIDAIAEIGGSTHGPHIRQKLEQNLPYSFIGQLDLASATVALPGDGSLPDTGRLLFFYDIDTGPWDTGTRAGKVIWDRSPAADTIHHPTPIALKKAEEDFIEEVRTTVFDMPNMDEDTVALIREMDPTFDPETLRRELENSDEPLEIANHYFGPEQPIVPVRYWMIPTEYSVDWDAFVAQLARILSRDPDDARDDFSLLLSDLEEAYETRDRAGSGASYFLGMPKPEQDDPRYDAAIVERLGRQFLPPKHTKADFQQIKQEARGWRLLFQVSLWEWLQDPQSEGVVYYLIRWEDLSAGRFDRVITVYQQT